MSSEPTNESVATWSALTPLPAQVPPPPFYPTRKGCSHPQGCPLYPRGCPPHGDAPFTRGGAPFYPRGCPPTSYFTPKCT